MKPCGKPWEQLNQEEKIECLHKGLTQARRAINRLYRLAYPELDSRETKNTKPAITKSIMKGQGR